MQAHPRATAKPAKPAPAPHEPGALAQLRVADALEEHRAAFEARRGLRARYEPIVNLVSWCTRTRSLAAEIARSLEIAEADLAAGRAALAAAHREQARVVGQRAAADQTLAAVQLTTPQHETDGAAGEAGRPTRAAAPTQPDLSEIASLANTADIVADAGLRAATEGSPTGGRLDTAAPPDAPQPSGAGHPSDEPTLDLRTGEDTASASAEAESKQEAAIGAGIERLEHALRIAEADARRNHLVATEAVQRAEATCAELWVVAAEIDHEARLRVVALTHPPALGPAPVLALDALAAAAAPELGGLSDELEALDAILARSADTALDEAGNLVAERRAAGFADPIRGFL